VVGGVCLFDLLCLPKEFVSEDFVKAEPLPVATVVKGEAPLVEEPKAEGLAGIPKGLPVF
jgi:hypothetical protein